MRFPRNAWAARETPIGELARQRQREFGRRKIDPLPERCAPCEYLSACAGGCPKHRFVGAASGAPENYLCPSYRKFFAHSAPGLAPFAAAVRAGARELTA